MTPGQLRRHYEQHGYALAPVVFPPSPLDRADRAMDAVMAGDYDTGVAPLGDWWSDAHDPATQLRRIDQPHVASQALYALVTHPPFGAAVAAITVDAGQRGLHRLDRALGRQR